MPDPFHIVFPIFPDITQLDFAGPAQFLSRLPGAVLHVAAATADPVPTDCGFAIQPTCGFADCPQAGLICVPGGAGVAPAIRDGAVVDFTRRQAAGAQWVTSVCTGAFILGAAGLLKGRPATTHWAYVHLLEKVGARYRPGRVVMDDRLITAGGVTSGIDFGLAVIARIAGETVAQSVQLALEYDPEPPFRGGHPDRADPATTAALKQRVYSAAAARMAETLGNCVSIAE